MFTDSIFADVFKFIYTKVYGKARSTAICRIEAFRNIYSRMARIMNDTHSSLDINILICKFHDNILFLFSIFLIDYQFSNSISRIGSYRSPQLTSPFIK